MKALHIPPHVPAANDGCGNPVKDRSWSPINTVCTAWNLERASRRQERSPRFYGIFFCRAFSLVNQCLEVNMSAPRAILLIKTRFDFKIDCKMRSLHDEYISGWRHTGVHHESNNMYFCAYITHSQSLFPAWQSDHSWLSHLLTEDTKYGDNQWGGRHHLPELWTRLTISVMIPRITACLLPL